MMCNRIYEQNSVRLSRSLLLRDIIIKSKSKSSSTAGNKNRRGTIPLSELFQTSNEDMFLHILDCIGAISTIRREQKTYFAKKPMHDTSVASQTEHEDPVIASKYCIFWQALQEIAMREAAFERGSDIYMKDHCNFPRTENLPLDQLMRCFPDESKQCDGRMWLPLHFAVVLPNTELADISNILTSQPLVEADDVYKCNPCHLAVMVQNPRLEVIQLLQECCPFVGSSLAYERDTPLHLAVMHSNSVVLVQELIRSYTPALEMRNKNGHTPLSLIYTNTTPEALRIVQSLLDAAPQVAQMVNPKTHQLPLNDILENSEIALPPPEVISALIAAYNDAVNIYSEVGGFLSVHYAAQRNDVAILKFIDEANVNNFSEISPEYGSVADRAVEWQNVDNLRYIHHRMPELLTAPNSDNYTLLETLFYGENEGKPSVARVDYLKDPLSAFSDILRFLLPLYSATEIARIGEGLLIKLSYPTDDDEADDDTHEEVDDETDPFDWQYPCRLLLRAGASFLQPDLLRKLNYIARRGALLAFFGRTVAAEPATIVQRIRHGAGGTELMRTIIGFL